MKNYNDREIMQNAQIYYLILCETCKRGCDHGDGDPRGEVRRSARDAVRAGGKPRSEITGGSESGKT